MLFDKQNMFSEDQAITASAASTNLFDLGLDARRIGVGTTMYLAVIVTEAFTDSGSDSTVTPSLQTDDNEAFGSATTIRTFDTIAATTAAGTLFVYSLDPKPLNTYERYIRLYYTVANGNLTTGQISAGLLEQAQLNSLYASGFTVA